MSNLPINFATASFLAQNWPAFYEMFPRTDFVGRLFDNFTFTLEGFQTTYGLTNQQSVLNVNDLNPLNDYLPEQADQLWTDIIEGNAHPNPVPKSFAINGSGQNTLDKLFLRVTPNRPNDRCIVPQSDSKGDGVVTQLSAETLPDL